MKTSKIDRENALKAELSALTDTERVLYNALLSVCNNEKQALAGVKKAAEKGKKNDEKNKKAAEKRNEKRNEKRTEKFKKTLDKFLTAMNEKYGDDIVNAVMNEKYGKKTEEKPAEKTEEKPAEKTEEKQ